MSSLASFTAQLTLQSSYTLLPVSGSSSPPMASRKRRTLRATCLAKIVYLSDLDRILDHVARFQGPNEAQDDWPLVDIRSSGSAAPRRPA